MTDQSTTGKINHNWLLGDESKTKIHSSVAEKLRGKGEEWQKGSIKITFQTSEKGRWQNVL